jgi:hypothetical protein
MRLALVAFLTKNSEVNLLTLFCEIDHFNALAK